LEKFFLEFIDLINKKKYFEAHEILEEIWFPKRKEKTPDILILKGFINASVAFELKKRGKTPQAKKVWKNYKKYLELINDCSSLKKEDLLKVCKAIEDEYEKILS